MSIPSEDVNIRKYLDGHTQIEIAFACGMTTQQVNNYVTGRVEPKVRQAIRLAQGIEAVTGKPCSVESLWEVK